MIRAIRNDDLANIKRIHEKYYKSEFNLPNFREHFLAAFVTEDETGNIISAGGVRTIPEVVIVTDKDISVRKRRKALIEMLHASMFTAEVNNYDQITAFIQDGDWQHHLSKFGFNECKGNALYLQLR